ncbi:MAG: hypothetical protein HY696_06445 [Deltaproteobacteria bacterium]|nr:hypothetical protein [Deltaproteobacteria bacterium]
MATLSLINQAGTIQLNPVSFTTTAKRPHFLWDYDLTETHVREILHTPGLSAQKRWLLGRLLTAARFEEIPAFVPITEIARHFHALRLSAKVRTRWAYALHHWGYDA